MAVTWRGKERWKEGARTFQFVEIWGRFRDVEVCNYCTGKCKRVSSSSWSLLIRSIYWIQGIGLVMTSYHTIIGNEALPFQLSFLVLSRRFWHLKAFKGKIWSTRCKHCKRVIEIFQVPQKSISSNPSSRPIPFSKSQQTFQKTNGLERQN